MAAHNVSGKDADVGGANALGGNDRISAFGYVKSISSSIYDYMVRAPAKRLTRRLSSYASRPRRNRASTCSTYYSVDDANNAFQASRISSANPYHHPDTFVESFRPWKIDQLRNLQTVTREERVKYAFNGQDTSPNIYVLEEAPLTIHRQPVAQSTDCIRGKVGFSHGVHVWKITWPTRSRGTHAMVGVATKEAVLQHNGYVSIVGLDEHSFGWDLVRNICFHDSRRKDSWAYPDPLEIPEFRAPVDFYCILDMDEGYMAFCLKNLFLGVAFRGLKGLTLYPIIGAVWGHCEVTMEYIGSLSVVVPLVELARRRVRRSFIAEGIAAEQLPLPPKLKKFIKFEPDPVWE